FLAQLGEALRRQHSCSVVARRAPHRLRENTERPLELIVTQKVDPKLAKVRLVHGRDPARLSGRSHHRVCSPGRTPRRLAPSIGPVRVTFDEILAPYPPPALPSAARPKRD